MRARLARFHAGYMVRTNIRTPPKSDHLLAARMRSIRVLLGLFHNILMTLFRRTVSIPDINLKRTAPPTPSTAPFPAAAPIHPLPAP